MRRTAGGGRCARRTRRTGAGSATAAAVAVVVGCATSPQATGPYPLAAATARPAAVSFFGVDGQRNPSSIRRGVGQIQLVLFDGSPFVAGAQQEVLRRTVEALHRPDVRLLRVTAPAGQLQEAHTVVLAGRLVTDKAAGDLAVAVEMAAAHGFAYTLVIDRRGRVAARLLGTSDPSRLAATVRQLLWSE
jgi:hypothetical protein